MEYETFVELHQSQLLGSGIPDLYWRSLFDKLSHEVYDAGSFFQMQQVLHTTDGEADEQDYVTWRIVSCSEEDISVSDAQHIYLIDHAWTYSLNDARTALAEVPGLVDRMASLMDIETDGKTPDTIKNDIMETMWKFNQTYSFGNFEMGSENAMPKWYIMDEFGSRIQHSDDPNVRVVPFFFAANGMAFSIMWPKRDIESGEELTRDFVEGERDPVERKARLLPWESCDLTHVSLVQDEPADEYFQGAANESLPPPDFKFPGLPRDRNLRVFVEYDVFKDHLTDKRFELVDDPKDADILWYMRHFYEFKELSEGCPDCLINQFPCESVLTIKNRLAATARRGAAPGSDKPLANSPPWLPVTYDLITELPKFVSHFQQRQEKGLDNHWIMKPWNLGRSLDTSISNNLNQIVRMRESGPKVACKYIEDPLLFYREDIGAKVKFDVRYIVLMSSVEPLKLYAYQVFWLRFANQPYTLDQLDEYEKHFTVMNYTHEGQRLKQVHYDEFIPEFEAQNPGFLWQDVENEIFIVSKELFQSATSMPAPHGIPHSPQSRALYALDFVLKWDTKPTGERFVQPILCEVNFCPDCERACKYHPFFTNDVFSVLFLDDTEGKHVVAL